MRRERGRHSLLLLALACAGWAPLVRAAGEPTADSPFDDLPGKAKDIRPQDVVRWEAIDAESNGNDRVVVGARMTVTHGWSIYSTNLSFVTPAGFTVEKIDGPKTTRILDPISGKDADVYTGGEFFITFSGPVDTTRDTFEFGARYVGCTQVICLFPYTETMFAPVRKPAPDAVAAPVPGLAPGGSGDQISAGSGSAPLEEDLQSQLATKLKGGSLSYGALLLLVFVGGLLSNLTPCVYPMIPITLRLLSKQGKSAYASAATYALGIVITYSVLGMFAVLSGGMFGALLASKMFNVAFAGVMFVLGLTMLGFGNFAQLQMLGSKMGAGGPSFRNTFLMGAGAGLVAAPCTGPILAALLVSLAKSNEGFARSVTLMFTYSLGFGIPYVFLGGAAAKVSKIKVSPKIQTGVKLLFAGVMFGLSLYYLRIPLHELLVAKNPNWGPIALVTGVIFAVGIVLANVIRSLEHSKAFAVVVAAALGVSLFATSQRLAAGDAAEKLSWHMGENEALAAAQSESRPILLDMGAEWCEACKEMDRTTFIDPAVKAALAQGWVYAKVDLTDSNPVNDRIQEKYAIQSLPTLVLLPRSGDPAKRKNLTGYIGAAALINGLKDFSSKTE